MLHEGVPWRSPIRNQENQARVECSDPNLLLLLHRSFGLLAFSKVPQFMGYNANQKKGILGLDAKFFSSFSGQVGFKQEATQVPDIS